MGKGKAYTVISVEGLTPKELEDKLNLAEAEGLKRVFQSDIHWYQGRGEGGIIVFERPDGPTHAVDDDIDKLGVIKELVNTESHFTKAEIFDKIAALINN